MAIGKLKEVELRDIWKHEEYDFSKWLAKEENISDLGEILGLSLIDVETENAYSFGLVRDIIDEMLPF